MRTGAGRTPLIIAGVAALVTYAAFGQQTPFGFLHKLHFASHHHVTVNTDGDTDDEDVVAGGGTETRLIAPFDSVVIEGTTDADITIGDTQSLTISAAGGASHTATAVHDGKLVVSGGGAAHLTITVPHLRAVQVDGTGKVTLAGLRDPISIKADGPVHVSASGAVDSTDLILNGPSKLDLTKLETRNVVIKLNGPADAQVSASENLTAEVTGPGRVRYLGEAHAVAKIHGPGSVERMSGSSAG